MKYYMIKILRVYREIIFRGKKVNCTNLVSNESRSTRYTLQLLQKVAEGISDTLNS